MQVDFPSAAAPVDFPSGNNSLAYTKDVAALVVPMYTLPSRRTNLCVYCHGELLSLRVCLLIIYVSIYLKIKKLFVISAGRY